MLSVDPFLIDPNQGVVRRYLYDPYSFAKGLDAHWATPTDPPLGWRHLHQGGRLDGTSGLYHFRARDYDPVNGRWAQRDPIGFAGGTSNLYQFVGGNPATFVDPTGLKQADATTGGGSSGRVQGRGPRSTPVGGWSVPAWEATKAFAGSLYQDLVGEYVDEATTVWDNTAHMSTVDRLYTTAGTTLGSVVGVRQLSDAFSRHDAVDGHEQSGWERVGDGVGGGFQLITSAFGLMRLGGKVKSAVGVHAPGDAVRAGAGHGYARQVLDGGSGNAFAGHGEFRLGSGSVTVLEGASITLPRDGIRILDRTAGYMERGDWDGLLQAARRDPRVADDLVGMATHLPGAQVPNYTLKAPNGLTIYRESITVEDATPLLDLLRPNSGPRVWAGCTELRR